MWVYGALFIFGWATGGLSCLLWVWALRNRLVSRLTAHRLLIETARDLESRRVTHDSGRDHLVRANGGQVGRVVDGMSTKPGALARYLSNQG